MNGYELVDKIKTAEDALYSLNSELKDFLRKHIEANRKYADGQKVEVFNDLGKSMGIGFIKSAQCGVSLRWGFRAADYLGRSESWERDLKDIMYEVVKAKKDGTPSSRTMMWEKARQEQREGRYFVKEVE